MLFFHRLMIVLTITFFSQTSTLGHHRNFSKQDRKSPHYKFQSQHHPQSTGKSYMGRPIAEVMGPAGIPWLDRPSRLKEEHLNTLVKNLQLKSGMRVADIGAGSGRISQMMAMQVGKTGKVYAIDIQEKMLAAIRNRRKKNNLVQLVPTLGTITSVPLAVNSIDLAILIDVYHEFSHPREMVLSITKALKPGGRLVLVEYRAEDPKVPIKRLHKMSLRQIRKEFDQKLYPLSSPKVQTNLPRQHMVIFTKL